MGLRDILRRIHAEQDEQRQIALSRLAKRTIPVIAPGGQGPEEARLLTQFAALALGDAGSWTQLGQPQALPAWLAAKLPEPISSAELGVEIRQDNPKTQVLHLVAAESAPARIAFPGPLPARLHVAGEGRAGAWHTVAVDSRIPISPPSPRLRLTTLDGRQWDLSTETLQDAGIGAESEQASSPLLLAYVEADREQAKTIADWLGKKGISVELVSETARAASEGTTTTEGRVLRLWTRAAQRFWAERTVEQDPARVGGLLLRTEEVDLPAAGAAGGQVLNWQDWSRLDQSPVAERLLRNLQRWPDGDEIESEPSPAAAAPPEASRRSEAYSAEVAALLAEIEDPATEPPRRLEIGDRLAELGDPRPGVGVVEIELPLDEDATTNAIAEPFPPEVQRLLDEIDDPATEPPRWLEIGDELERLGDPRHGVGLDEKGLPDIDWVEVPGGPFIYQDGETRELPTFWIARYPITTKQFQAFIDAGGYEQGPGVLKQVRRLVALSGRDAGWWQDLEQPKPKKSTWAQGNRPRTDVDWYEAVAFTRWLTAQLGLTDGAVRLPTEFEWEKAARGEKGLTYPWGNEYRTGFANINETEGQDGPWYLEQTTAVGMYPHGRSSYGLEDLAGNVWEWCLNKYDQPDVTRADTSSDSRGLRGGSWFLYSDGARADYRSWPHPDLRHHHWGFRVLSSVPIAVR